MKRTGSSLQTLDDLARTTKTGLEEINAIAGSIREGKGSLGKLVRDEAAYQSLMSLTHRGERTFSAMEDNLAALKRTWPLSRYSDSRSYFEREKVLYQPGSRRDSRSFRDEELFEPGRAILTPVGRTRLDEVGRWCEQASQPQSEVVIAAFTDDDQDVDLAEVLTQEQADSVRKYLIEKHGIDSAGWFRIAQGRRGRLRHPGPRLPDPPWHSFRRAGSRSSFSRPRPERPGFRPGSARPQWSGTDMQPMVFRAGVLGAGQMGAGIAAALIRTGISTTMVDVNQDMLDSGSAHARQLAAGRSKSEAGQADDAESARIAALLSTSTSPAPLADCDVVIEAVTENEAIKTGIFEALAGVLRDEAILASNTSTIPISRMARSWVHPERFAGMHFFHPAQRMELVEVIRGEQTDEQTVTALVDLSRRLGKTPIVVRDCPGFLVTRVLFPYLGQALELLLEGVPMDAIDAAAVQFGMPTGPIALHDFIGLDTVLAISRVMAEGYPDRAQTSPLLVEMVRAGPPGPEVRRRLPQARSQRVAPGRRSRFRIASAPVPTPTPRRQPFARPGRDHGPALPSHAPRGDPGRGRRHRA